jgi:hypothetical protein
MFSACQITIAGEKWAKTFTENRSRRKTSRFIGQKFLNALYGVVFQIPVEVSR